DGAELETGVGRFERGTRFGFAVNRHREEAGARPDHQLVVTEAIAELEVRRRNGDVDGRRGGVVPARESVLLHLHGEPDAELAPLEIRRGGEEDEGARWIGQLRIASTVEEIHVLEVG